ncbi:MAG: type II toxin-antitoxin system RelE/ParE family toxin [Alphaproteobacteria bacterium]|nr:type II toxin-antitoxin system RelE/ParE family toxin [Alphaproteobacteria bacterium]
MPYVLSNRADADLDEILAYSLKTFGEANAEVYFLSLRDCLHALADNPGMGQAVDDLHPGLRRHHHRRHAIYYVIEQPGIFVVRVLHQSMDAPRHLGSDSNSR